MFFHKMVLLTIFENFLLVNSAIDCHNVKHFAKPDQK